jgi:translation initiation factor 1
VPSSNATVIVWFSWKTTQSSNGATGTAVEACVPMPRTTAAPSNANDVLQTLQLGRDTGLTSDSPVRRPGWYSRRYVIAPFRQPRPHYDPAVSNSRLVYSTDDGDRRREPEPTARPSAPPSDGIVRVSREKSGRRGKTVTIVRGLPAGALAAAATDLKRLCGTGGTVKEGTIELQGDHRDKAAARLRAQGHEVKLAGG